MTQFLKDGSMYFPQNTKDVQTEPQLPGGVFVIKQMPMGGPMYFQMVDSFSLSHKLYGDTTRHAERIFNTFLDRDTSTGVLLEGEKGSGKTLLAKKLALIGEEHGIPTILINAPWCGDAFNQLMQQITQPTIVLFDEFEKVYDREHQEQVLTLFDGVFPSKKLFVVTCNDKYKLDVNMHNRPGRLFYMLEYRGLEMSFIREYCADNLNNQEHTEGVCRVATVIGTMNFDILKAMVEEMNRYKETAAEVMQLLNAKPTESQYTRYKVTVTMDGYTFKHSRLSPQEWRGSPLAAKELPIYVDNDYALLAEIDAAEEKKEPVNPVARRRADSHRFNLFPKDLVKIDPDTGIITYGMGNYLVTFEKEPAAATVTYYG